MRSTKSKNQNKQIPSEQGRAVQITINEDDVNYAIKKLSLYDDCFSKGIVTVFSNYLDHKDFKKMRDDFDAVPETTPPPYLLWDVDTNMGFMDVIYPEAEKGAGDD